MAEAAGDENEDVANSEVWQCNEVYWSAFHTLSRSRGSVGGLTVLPLPISYSEIAKYGFDHRLIETVGDLEEFEELIQAMDKVHLEFAYGRAAEKGKRRTRN